MADTPALLVETPEFEVTRWMHSPMFCESRA
jgi:hypothetical protein